MAGPCWRLARRPFSAGTQWTPTLFRCLAFPPLSASAPLLTEQWSMRLRARRVLLHPRYSRATARRTARRFGVDFDAARLLEPAYNAKLGTAHLGELIEDWKGFPVLMFAAYNAGGGNVSKWIKAYGDQRSPKVDPIDWVERIPFSETRNYVQRVMESMLVYQHRLRSQSATVRPTEAASSQPNLVP